MDGDSKNIKLFVELLRRYIYGSKSEQSDTTKDVSEGMGRTAENASTATSQSTFGKQNGPTA